MYDIRKFFDKENLRDVMNTFKKCGISPRLYRTWFTLNRNTVIIVKTGAGMTAKAVELIGQGSAGGALASQVNIDMGL